ncbi:MAG: hypothetical protein WEB06_19030 [Actinomycetota bacterium]
MPARAAPEALARLVAAYTSERREGEAFADWVDRIGVAGIEQRVADLEHLPAKEEAPELFEAWGSSEPFRVILGRGECAS